MIVFILIIFGLATLRTISEFAKAENYKSGSKFIACLLVCITTIYAYGWLLNYFLQIKN